jgi:hypothetical protein
MAGRDLRVLACSQACALQSVWLHWFSDSNSNLNTGRKGVGQGHWTALCLPHNPQSLSRAKLSSQAWFQLQVEWKGLPDPTQEAVVSGKISSALEVVHAYNPNPALQRQWGGRIESSRPALNHMVIRPFIIIIISSAFLNWWYWGLDSGPHAC